VESGRFSYDRVYTECLKKIKEFCNLLSSNGMDQLWCLDGNRSDDKLATSRRVSAKEPKLNELATIHKRCSQLITSGSESTEDYSVEARALLPYAFLKEYWPLCENESQSPTGSLESQSSGQEAVMDQIDTFRKTLAKYPVIPKDFAEVMERELRKQGCEFLCVPEISEGEKLCVIAIQSGYCQAVFTTDSDVLPMGARYVIKEIKDGVARIYSYTQALHNLGMKHEQFLSLCIMLGNDFNDGIEGMAKTKCLVEVTKEDFNIYDFDLSRCGCLRTNTCINAFTISLKECELACAAIEKL
jgi:hypothetical protein